MGAQEESFLEKWKKPKRFYLTFESIVLSDSTSSVYSIFTIRDKKLL